MMFAKGGESLGSHFITGFPGFVATEMVHQLFRQNVTKEVFAVVLLSDLAKAKGVVQTIEKQYEGCQIVLFEGDITIPDLDIADQDFELIAPKIEVAWHLAAIHDESVGREKAWKVNVHGTANVNEFVCHLPNLKRYMYFSTAFIAGKRKGKILEMELIRPAEFHNFLEETKFEAELLVDDLKLEVPITIVRPTMIYGNSKTGVTGRFDGIYFLMILVDYLKEQFLFPQIGGKQTDLHAVAVDYVVEASVALSLQKEAEGETVHLTASKPPKVLTVYQELVKLMTHRKTFGILPLGIAKAMLEQQSIRNAWHVTPKIIDYLDSEAEFDTTDCERLLMQTKICPTDLLQALPNLVRFYEENKHVQSFHMKI